MDTEGCEYFFPLWLKQRKAWRRLLQPGRKPLLPCAKTDPSFATKTSRVDKLEGSLEETNLYCSRATYNIFGMNSKLHIFIYIYIESNLIIKDNFNYFNLCFLACRFNVAVLSVFISVIHSLKNLEIKKHTHTYKMQVSKSTLSYN